MSETGGRPFDPTPVQDRVPASAERAGSFGPAPGRLRSVGGAGREAPSRGPSGRGFQSKRGPPVPSPFAPEAGDALRPGHNGGPILARAGSSPFLATKVETRSSYTADRSPADMVDRVYKGAFRAFRADLQELREGFARIKKSGTDWNRLRIEPLVKHVETLEAILRSKRFAGEVSRLKRGVSMFHSDLVYLRHNIRELQKLLDHTQRASERKR